MIKLPMKFYTAAAPSTPSTSNKKYEISITQPPKHEPTFDFIRGISYDAKDNAIHCKFRETTLDDVKEIKPDATEVSKDTYILQDMNGNDLIITSDMIENMAQMLVILHASEGVLEGAYVAHVEFYMPKLYYEGKSIATVRYIADKGGAFYIKISDVDIWLYA